jgi:hypothetical protein
MHAIGLSELVDPQWSGLSFLLQIFNMLAGVHYRVAVGTDHEKKRTSAG